MSLTEASIPTEVLVGELEPVIETLYDRHLANATQWYPHQLTPWSEGRNYQPGESWSPDDYPIPDGVRSAIFVNLLTEDNLPYYFETINRMADNEVWAAWTKRWTAEEGRHSIVLRNWVEIERPIDPVALEDARMAQVSKGQVPNPGDFMQGIAYVSLQELATQVAHRNTGRHLLDEYGKKIMGRVAGDETLHHNFYRDLAVAMFEFDPSAMMIATAKQFRGFDMPGTGIVDFDIHQAAISKSGIYDVEKFKEKVAGPTLEYWDIWHMEGLDSEAERARDSIARRLKVLGRVANLA